MSLPGQCGWCILGKFQKFANFQVLGIFFITLLDISFTVLRNCFYRNLQQKHSYFLFQKSGNQCTENSTREHFSVWFISYLFQRIKLSVTTRFYVPIIIYNKRIPNSVLEGWEPVPQSKKRTRGIFQRGSTSYFFFRVKLCIITRFHVSITFCTIRLFLCDIK